MSVPLECIPVMIEHVLTVSTQREAMTVFVGQTTLEMERLVYFSVLIFKIACIYQNFLHPDKV